MKDKTVSIIVPVYNTGKYLEKCISSVLSQTYQNFEVVLINDASSDNSDELCKEYCKNDARFKYIVHESNKGQTLSILEGLDRSEGEWMMFLDSDDYLMPDALETLVTIAIKDDANIVLANYETFTDEGDVMLFTADVEDGCYKTADFISNLYNKVPLNVLSCIGTKLYKMDFVKNQKPRTPDTLRTNYDIAFILDSLLTSPVISYVNKVTYMYYQRTNSITHTYRNNMFSNLTAARAKLLPLLKECGCYENKKTDYHLTRYTIIRWSLMQEVEFKKGYKHYKDVFDTIYSDPNTAETINVILESQNDKKRRLLMYLLKHNRKVLTYFMLKLWLLYSRK